MRKRFRKPMPVVLKVTPLSKYRLLVTFATGENKIYDASWVLTHPLTTELRDVSRFNKVYVLNGTVAWSKNLDLGPDDLYENSIIVKKDDIKELMAG